MSRVFIVILFSYCCIQESFGQSLNKSEFQSPLNIPLILSGNFGELRATHFHAGLDFKTQGETGKPVFAAASGYVSRIKIQSGGYGHSIYITHPDGHTTVYAHLEKYAPEIDEYVLQSQYEKRSFEIELFPAQEKFVIERGQLIGYSGNTGSSGGPHLHFEIRKTLGQIPLNGLLFDFPVEDNTIPDFKSLFVYSYYSDEPLSMNGLERKMYTVRKKNGGFVVDDVIECRDNFVGFGAEVYDYLNGANNRCGVYMMQMNIDGVPKFMFQIDAVSFGNSRYVNAHMDYDLKINEGRSVHRLFLLPNNSLPIYSCPDGNGLLYLADDSVHDCQIIAVDAYGNTSTLEFSCKRNSEMPATFFTTMAGSILRWKEGGNFTLGSYNFNIPPRALYQDAIFDYYIAGSSGDPLIDTMVINSSREPVHIGFSLSARVGLLPEKYKNKYLFARVESRKIIAEGGEYNNGELSIITRNFGSISFLPIQQLRYYCL